MKRSLKDVSIGVRDIKCSKSLILKSGITPRDLFSLVVEGQRHELTDNPIPVTLTKERTPFQLYFNPSLIADCEVIQGEADNGISDQYSVTGTAFVLNKKGEELDSQEFKINVEFKEIKADVKVEFSIPHRRINFKDLPADRIVSVGAIQIFNPKKFERSPKINFKGTLSLVDSKGRELPPLLDENGEITPRIFFSESGKNDIMRQEVRSLPIQVDGNGDYKPLRKEIKINFSGIPNPVEPYDFFSILFNGSWAYSYQPDIPNIFQENKAIRLMKDTQGTELRVTMNGNPLSSGHNSILPVFDFSPGGAFRKEVIIELDNIATDATRDGYLRIMTPRISTSIEQEGIHIYGANGRPVDINKIVSLEGDFYEITEERGYIDIPNGDTVPEKLKVMYNPSDIFSINSGGQYRFSVSTSIEIDYYENSDNRPRSEVERKTFRIVLSREMYILPFPEWLCVDYGSSAIVSLYKGDLLDLNARRKDILNQLGKSSKDWYPRTKGNENETERDTVFISSDLLLNTVTGIDPENPISMLCGEQTQEQLDYSKTAVCLAPTNNVAKSNYQRILPCLKLLVGNKYLPDNPDYNAFEYYRKDDNENLGKVRLSDAKENNESNSLASINNLFDEAYKVVFRHYLSKLIPHIERVNKLVLTYPNSYTPDHLKVLRNIATDTFRYLREGQLQFVSESDAVAAYYMDHWSEYNPGGDIKKPENILVFDMGAGTLDLTYLSKTYNPQKDSYLLDIKGKLGISKAGNYLDFILAKIVAKIGGKATKNLADTERPAGVNADRIARGRIVLKDFVKNSLKPLLSIENEDKIINFEYNDEEIEIKIRDVINHPDFRKYLFQVTTQVLKSMRNYLGGEMDIDSVILSGRSVRLQPLQEVLSKSLNEFSSDSEGIRFIDLDINGEHDRQKTAVVEGAVKFAGSYNSNNSKVHIRSRRLYASFGVAFRHLGGEWDYIELASHNDMPLNSDNSSKEFPPILISGLSHTEDIKLIQSYLPQEETLNAIKNGDFEYISEMNTFNLSSFGGRDTLEMAINIDRHNQISLYVDKAPTSGSAPRGIDLNNEITRRSIWPATI